MPAVLVPLGQLLGVAAACGLNLYATVALLGLASRLDWISLPVGLHGLEHGLLIASALALYGAEFVIDKRRHLDSLWNALHTVIRPPAAALLTYAALASLDPTLQLAGAVGAGALTLAVHGIKSGLRITTATRSARPAPVVASVLEDAAAVGLVLAVLIDERAAMAAAGLLPFAIILLGPRYGRAFAFGLRALRARIRGFFNGARWHTPRDLPADLRALLADTPPGLAAPRVTRAAIDGVPGVGAYRNGWLVSSTEGLVFLYRSFLRPRRLGLSLADGAATESGPLADRLDSSGTGARFTLFLLKDGPPASQALDHLLVPAGP